MAEGTNDRVLKYLGLERSQVTMVTREVFEESYYFLLSNPKSIYSFESNSHFDFFRKTMDETKLTRNTRKDVALAMCKVATFDEASGNLVYKLRACCIFLNCKSSEKLAEYLLEDPNNSLFYRLYYVFDEATDLKTSLGASELTTYQLLCNGVVLLPLASIISNTYCPTYSIVKQDVTRKDVEDIAKSITLDGKTFCYISTFSDPLREFGHNYHNMQIEFLYSCSNVLFRSSLSDNMEVLLLFKNPVFEDKLGEVTSVQEIFSQDIHSDKDKEQEEEDLVKTEDDYYLDAGQY